MKLLVTGFEPFNGQTVNPSQQIVERLTAPQGVTLIRAILPVEFENAAAQVKKLFREHQPDVVAGKKTGRENGQERIICQLVGMGCPDICVATLVYQRILEKGEATASVDMMQ